jgi:hypothetical protein
VLVPAAGEHVDLLLLSNELDVHFARDFLPVALQQSALIGENSRNGNLRTLSVIWEHYSRLNFSYSPIPLRGMHAAADVNIRYYASAIVITNELIESISSLKS